MKTNASYIPSQTLAGDTDRIRQHSFTRWMSRDLMQAATDFCRHLGLIAIYAECLPDHQTRYLFWRLPKEARTEVRSGRTEAQFRAFDQANAERGWPLLSLHISENDLSSAVWISPEHHEAATAMLAFYGITPATRQPGA